MLFDPTKIIGVKTGPHKITYSWRDIILYALSIGAKAEDEAFVWEKIPTHINIYESLQDEEVIKQIESALKVYPSFAAIAVYTPPLTPPKALGYDTTGFLHMEHDLILHSHIHSSSGVLHYTPEIVQLYDRGEGKGVQAIVDTTLFDDNGHKIATNISTTYMPFGGGFGGEKPPKSNIEMPHTPPKYTETINTSNTAALLYRLLGDTYGFHVDFKWAREKNFDKPIMHGLGTFGMACRMLVNQLTPGEPERMIRMKCRISKPFYPGHTLRLEAWLKENGAAYFRAVNVTRNEVVLDKGVVEWRS